MFPSIFTDELGLDITKALPIIQSWGLQHVDLRGASSARPPSHSTKGNCANSSSYSMSTA
jgi:hypothetical protein